MSIELSLSLDLETSNPHHGKLATVPIEHFQPRFSKEVIMGKVFSFDEITQRNNGPEHQSNLHENIQFLSEALVENENVIGALIYGSTAFQRTTIRSDMDVLIIIRTVTIGTEKGRDLGHLMQELQQRGAIPSFEIVPLKFAQSGCHSLDTLFWKHLKEAADRPNCRIGENPITQFSSPRLQPFLESLEDSTKETWNAEQYLGLQQRRLCHGIELWRTYSPERYLVFLQKVLEAPVHTSRRVLQARGLTGASASKKEIRSILTDHVDSSVQHRFDQLLELDGYYTRTLESQLKRPDQSQYEEALQIILYEAPQT